VNFAVEDSSDKEITPTQNSLKFLRIQSTIKSVKTQNQFTGPKIHLEGD